MFPLLSVDAERVLRGIPLDWRDAMTSMTLQTPPEQPGQTALELTVADAVWIAAALLHHSTQSEGPFSTEDIAAAVQNRHLTNGAPKSIWQHVNQHCVANRKPQPNRACMLFAVGQGNRRLFRDSDRPHPEREGGRTHPAWDKLPPQYAFLQHWYETKWNKAPEVPVHDPLLALAGAGHGMWNGQTPDDYVTSLREGWEARR
jgi:hypothetical protein